MRTLGTGHISLSRHTVNLFFSNSCPYPQNTRAKWCPPDVPGAPGRVATMSKGVGDFQTNERGSLGLRRQNRPLARYPARVLPSAGATWCSWSGSRLDRRNGFPIRSCPASRRSGPLMALPRCDRLDRRLGRSCSVSGDTGGTICLDQALRISDTGGAISLD